MKMMEEQATVRHEEVPGRYERCIGEVVVHDGDENLLRNADINERTSMNQSEVLTLTTQIEDVNNNGSFCVKYGERR